MPEAVLPDPPAPPAQADIAAPGRVARPRVTVFTPAFNRCHTLPRLYASLLRQDGADLEWLIIDDGSTDGTRAWVEATAATAAIPIRYEHQANAGKQAAWNRAVALAAAPWFVGVDSDDALADGMLPRALALCDEVLGADDRLIGVRLASLPDGDRAAATGQRLFEGPHSYFAELAAGRFEERIDVFRTALLRRFPYPVGPGVRFVPEIWFYVTTAGRGYRLHYSRLPLGLYHSDHRGLSRTSIAAHARGHLIARTAMLRHCPAAVWRRRPGLLARTVVRWLQAAALVLLAGVRR